MDNPDRLSVYEVEREPLRRRYVRPTGRHRLRRVDDRDGDPDYGDIAYAVECGCGHRRIIGRDALKRKLLRATEPRIWL